MKPRASHAITAVLCCFLLGAGCAPVPPRSSVREASTPSPQREKHGSWQDVAEGAQRATFVVRPGAVMTMYRLDPAAYNVSMRRADAPARVSAWAKDAPDAALVVNGVYFNPDYRPTGFVAAAGEDVGGPRFDLERSGVIVFSPEFAIVPTKTHDVDFESLRDAAQSYPLLIADAVSAIAEDSGRRARRTFIGVDDSGDIYFGVVPHAEVTLHELMTALVGSGISWRHAINLDGGTSTGLSASFAGNKETFESFAVVPNVIAASRRAKK